jgi:hypothetical protein
VGGRILVRGEIAPGSQLGAAADLRIDVLGAGGELYATVTWSRAACEERPRSVRCVDSGGDAIVELRLRDSGGWALRAKLKGLTLPTRLGGPITVSFGEAGSRPLDWTSSECRDARSRLTCSDGD